jgi:hypothetical protein
MMGEAGPARQTTEPSETPPRELTLDEAVALAILLQENGQLVEAQEVYRPGARDSPEAC